MVATNGNGQIQQRQAKPEAGPEAERRVGFVAKKRTEGPCGQFVGGFEIDPALPHVCQVCEWSRDEHGSGRRVLRRKEARA